MKQKTIIRPYDFIEMNHFGYTVATYDQLLELSCARIANASFWAALNVRNSITISYIFGKRYNILPEFL